MNYGYAPTLFDMELAERLQTEVLDKLPADARGQWPYIEINITYPGVRIRRITHYSDEVIDEIVADCDKIYREMCDSYDAKHAVK